MKTGLVRVLKSNDPCWCGSGRKYKRCHRATEGHGPAWPRHPMRERAGRRSSPTDYYRSGTPEQTGRAAW